MYISYSTYISCGVFPILEVFSHQAMSLGSSKPLASSLAILRIFTCIVHLLGLPCSDIYLFYGLLNAYTILFWSSWTSSYDSLDALYFSDLFRPQAIKLWLTLAMPSQLVYTVDPMHLNTEVKQDNKSILNVLPNLSKYLTT